jgi:tripartite-type tricarboxylate transporter receptor subunit TctC
MGFHIEGGTFMLRKRGFCFFIFFLLSFALLAGTAAFAQPKGYPSKPISLLIPFPAGGGSDIIARGIVHLDTKYFKVNMIPVIKSGASGSIATDFLYRAKPDGYTLLFGAPHMITLLPQVKKVNYDPLKLIPVSLINESNSVLLSPKKRPWKTWEEFLAYAKKNPGKLSYGSTGTWGIVHVRLAALMRSFDLQLVHVPYHGAGESNQGLIRGEIDIATAGPATALSAIATGHVQALALISARHKDLPGVRSFAEIGIDLPVAAIWRGIFAPPGTPREIVSWLDSRFAALVKDKQFVETMNKLGEDIAYLPGDKFAEKIKKEYKVYGEVIKSIAAKEKKK